jgi:PIN domain nuclease of toxin-antitoxin system
MGRDEVILLDTHAAIWLANEDRALGRASRSMALEAREEGRLSISVVSFWEIALLAAKKRMVFLSPIAELRIEFLGTGVNEISLNGEIAILSVELENLHGDPADRFIAATAVAHNATLITADERLLRWRHPLPRFNATE